MDLFDFKDKNLRQVRTLSQQEFDGFRSAVLRLRRFRRWDRTLLAVKDNQLEYEDAIAGIPSVLATSPNLSTAHETLDDLANRRFLNYLASFRFFLDHTETRLARSYRKDPSVRGAFAVATTTAFDRTFAYRFLYKLRNYAQHCGVPIGHVKIDTVAAEPHAAVVQRMAALSLDVPELLEQFDKWGPVEKDLRAGPQLLDIALLLEPVWSELTFIRNAVAQAERPILQEDAQVIEAMFAPVVATGGVPTVGLLRPRQGGRLDVDLVQPPADVLAWLGVSYTAIVI